MKSSDLFVQCLENEGVKYVLGVPGEENLDLLESIRQSSLELVLTRHEQSAGFMAATIGRLTGLPGVCLSTLGPGATNFVTAAAYAQLGAMPMCMITGQKPVHSSKQGHFQIIDTVDMMRPITKYTRQLGHGNRIPYVIREAFKIAEEERPGAVHIELPEDVASEDTHTRPIPIFKVRRPDANDKAVSIAVAMIEQAKSPLILIGAGANRKRISKMLSRLIEKTGIPFFLTQMGKGVVAEDHPLCLGTAALSDKDYLHCAVDRSDLIINVGHDVIEKPPFFMTESGARVIHVNYYSASVDEVYFPQHEVVGDIANALWQISESIRPQTDWNFEYFMRVKKFVDEKIAEKNDDDRFPVIPQRLVADVRSVMDREDIIALDNGIYKVWFARNYRALAPNTVLLDNALATMGAGLPSAMAARMICPERKVLAICGDGGFMMNSQELETAVRMQMNLVILILNDSAYGMIRWKQNGMGFPDFGLEYGNPDFIKYVESYGGHGYRITNTAQLRQTLEKTLNSPGVHLIDCPVDYSENSRVLTDELESREIIE